jgi:hypothetical protein
MAQINISLPQDQLKQNRSLLLFMGGVSAVSGLFLWSAVPFALPNPQNSSQILARYLALVSSLGCGVSAVVSGKKLKRITPLIQAIETAEQDDFLLQLAVSQYAHETAHWNTVLKQAPVSPEISETALPVSEVSNEVKTSGNDAIPTTAENYRPLYLAVKHLKQEGVSDSKIVKQVLGMEGANFSKGQKALQAILDLGLQQNW